MVNILRPTEFIERRILVSQFHVNVTEKNHRVFGKHRLFLEFNSTRTNHLTINKDVGVVSTG